MRRENEDGYVGDERRRRIDQEEIDPVVLTRKLADEIDGVSLTGRDVGERLPLPRREAELLIAEGWAERVAREQRRACRAD